MERMSREGQKEYFQRGVIQTVQVPFLGSAPHGTHGIVLADYTLWWTAWAYGTWMWLVSHSDEGALVQSRCPSLAEDCMGCMGWCWRTILGRGTHGRVGLDGAEESFLEGCPFIGRGRHGP